MAKRDVQKGSKDPDPPKRRSEPPRFTAAAIMPSQNIKRVSSKEVFEEIKDAIEGWDKEMADILAMPKEMYRQCENGEISYSESTSFGMGGVFHGLSAEQGAKPASDYGIYLTESSHNTFFSFVDLHRGILVRISIVNIDANPPEKTWDAVKDVIKSALKFAQEESKKGPEERRIVYSYGGSQPVFVGPF